MKRIILDSSKCTGCRVCEAICSLVNEGEFNPVKARIKPVRRIEDNILYSIPVYCLQCEKPYCKEICPAGAIIHHEKGMITVHEDRCIGCKLCEIACPVGAISVNPEKKVALKCDLCVDTAGEPQCVRFCNHDAVKLIESEAVGVSVARSKAEKFLDMAKKEA